MAQRCTVAAGVAGRQGRAASANSELLRFAGGFLDFMCPVTLTELKCVEEAHDEAAHALFEGPSLEQNVFGRNGLSSMEKSSGCVKMTCWNDLCGLRRKRHAADDDACRCTARIITFIAVYRCISLLTNPTGLASGTALEQRTNVTRHGNLDPYSWRCAERNVHLRLMSDMQLLDFEGGQLTSWPLGGYRQRFLLSSLKESWSRTSQHPQPLQLDGGMVRETADGGQVLGGDDADARVYPLASLKRKYNESLIPRDITLQTRTTIAKIPQSTLMQRIRDIKAS